ncbi:hypothetical protein [Polynucleobacter necessarius]|uniref:hypothetical protein n=1 Tax=Polynucleobacter necessarius TaxID=576610 RepID=UPI001E63F87E|nr:hypothetical protein [Polynucleobacter necessarius]
MAAPFFRERTADLYMAVLSLWSAWMLKAASPAMHRVKMAFRLIGRSSGNPELDRQALAIVRASALFGPFSSEMRNQIDVLDWVSTFEFTRDGIDRLELRH